MAYFIRVFLIFVKVVLYVLTLLVGVYTVLGLAVTIKKLLTGGDFFYHGGNEIVVLAYLVPLFGALVLVCIPFRNVTLSIQTVKPKKIVNFSTTTIWFATLTFLSLCMHIATRGLLHISLVDFPWFNYLFLIGSIGLVIALGFSKGKNIGVIAGMICMLLYLGGHVLIFLMQRTGGTP